MSKSKLLIRRHLKRTAIAIVGGIVVLIGIVAIPYPGPGWLIVFAGLAILATEFEWAGRLLEKLRTHYNHWLAWVKRRGLLIRAVLGGITAAVVVFTMYLLNMYGLIDNWLQLGMNWLHSPLPIYR